MPKIKTMGTPKVVSQQKWEAARYSGAFQNVS